MSNPETVHTEVVSEESVTVSPDDAVAPDPNAESVGALVPGLLNVIVWALDETRRVSV